MAKSLPPKASLRQLRLQAKDLLKAYWSRDAEALRRLRGALPRLAEAADEAVSAAGCTLQDIQYVIAFEYGFQTWAALRVHVESPSIDVDLAAASDTVTASDADALDRLLSSDPDLIHRRQSEEGNTLLHTAASHASVEILRRLIDAGADLNAHAGEGWTPLHNAAGVNRVEIVAVLLAAGADAELEACGSGGTPLVHALFHGHRDAAQALARHSLTPLNLRVAAGLGRMDLLSGFFDGTALRPEAGNDRGFYRHHDEYPPWSPSTDPQEILDEALVYASQNQQHEAVLFLLDHGAHVSGTPYYASALHWAAYNGDEKMVDLLLRHGADPAVRDGMHGGTPRNWAGYGSRSDLASRLGVPDGADVVDPANPVTMFELVEQGRLQQIEDRIAAGADPGETRMISWEISGAGLKQVEQTLMQACASAGRTDIGEWLLAAGADVDVYMAAFLGKRERVEVLLGASESVDATDGFGMTALHRAIQGNAETIVDLLLHHGADVGHSADTYTFGARALHVAAASGASRQVMERLIASGADVNQRVNPGTPMQIAQRHGNHATVQILRDLGARTEGGTPPS